MNSDLDYLYYVLGSLVAEGLLSWQEADKIYTKSETTGSIPKVSFIPTT